MGAKGVDPLREGANARRHKPQESLYRPEPIFGILGFAFAPPISKELVISESQRGSQS